MNINTQSFDSDELLHLAIKSSREGESDKSLRVEFPNYNFDVLFGGKK